MFLKALSTNHVLVSMLEFVPQGAYMIAGANEQVVIPIDLVITVDEKSGAEFLARSARGHYRNWKDVTELCGLSRDHELREDPAPPANSSEVSHLEGLKHADSDGGEGDELVELFGEKMAGKIRGIGVTNAEELAEAEVSTLTEISGVGETTAVGMKESAAAFVAARDES